MEGAGPLWPQVGGQEFAGRGLAASQSLCDHCFSASPELAASAARISFPEPGPSGIRTPPGSERRERKARRGPPPRVTRRGQNPLDPQPRSLLSSERRGLPCAMRQKWPVRAAVAREVCVATEMTSDLEGPLGVRELSCCCYGDHVAGPRCRRDSARAGPASASIAAHAWGPRAQHPRRGVLPGRPRAEGLRKSWVPAHRWPPPPVRPPGRRGEGSGLGWRKAPTSARSG